MAADNGRKETCTCQVVAAGRHPPTKRTKEVDAWDNPYPADGAHSAWMTAGKSKERGEKKQPHGGNVLRWFRGKDLFAHNNRALRAAPPEREEEKDAKFVLFHDRTVAGPGTLRTRSGGGPLSVFTPCHEGVRRLRRFQKEKVGTYATYRSEPAVDKASRMSPYFAAGAISVCEALGEARKAKGDSADFSVQGGMRGSLRGSARLREFYRHIMGHYTTAKSTTEAYMHNRLRTNVASYLRTNLLMDYLWDERYLAEHLINWGLCNNTQGWEPSYTVFGLGRRRPLRGLKASASRMDDTSMEMQRFLQCMEYTYGKSERLSDDVVKKWVPPDLDNNETGQRNLWIDVFGVFNFVTLYQKTGNYKYLRLAGQLVRRVHHVLGRTEGWNEPSPWCHGQGASLDAALGYVILGYLKFDAHRFGQGAQRGPNAADKGLSLADEIGQYRRVLEDARFETPNFQNVDRDALALSLWVCHLSHPKAEWGLVREFREKSIANLRSAPRWIQPDSPDYLGRVCSLAFAVKCLGLDEDAEFEWLLSGFDVSQAAREEAFSNRNLHSSCPVSFYPVFYAAVVMLGCTICGLKRPSWRQLILRAAIPTSLYFDEGF
ncbi:hypothetical protein DL770_002845 [Monosporascus sp. CRB-9-2]|nr:hypothetical protein DL770_002845 [Monosporascus sp. CRB-9-2]